MTDLTAKAQLADLPQLAPEEHAELERLVGRKLSNEQAQLLLRDSVLTPEMRRWLEEKGIRVDGHEGIHI